MSKSSTRRWISGICGLSVITFGVVALMQLDQSKEAIAEMNVKAKEIIAEYGSVIDSNTGTEILPAKAGVVINSNGVDKL